MKSLQNRILGVGLFLAGVLLLIASALVTVCAGRLRFGSGCTVEINWAAFMLGLVAMLAGLSFVARSFARLTSR